MRTATRLAAALTAALAGAAGLPAAAAHAATAPAYNVALGNMAGYLINVAEQGYPYTGVQATFKLPKITKVSTTSYAFADYVAAIGEEHGNGVVVGVQELMDYGVVSYQAFTAFGTQVNNISGFTVKPGDTIKVSISLLNSGNWNLGIDDKTTRAAVATGGPAPVAGYDAEVVELDPANPIGPGYLPLAATTPVTFDHATFTDANNKTYPFLDLVSGESVPTTAVMIKSGTTKAIATPSAPDSDSDGFAVADGATPPKPPRS